MATKSNKLPNLEESLAEITQLIDTMEHGDLTLEKSLSQFERGITLVKHCQKILEQAEQKVQILVQNNTQLADYGDKDEDAEENADDE